MNNNIQTQETMKKYGKTSHSMYLKKITSSFPKNPFNETLKQSEFKLVLPRIQRDVSKIDVYIDRGVIFFYFGLFLDNFRQGQQFNTS